MGAPWLAVVAPYVLEGLPIGLYLADHQGVLVHANRAALDILGVRSLSEIESRTLVSFAAAPPDELQLPHGVVEIKGRDGQLRIVDHEPVHLGSATLAAELSCGVLRRIADPVERADIEARRLMDLGSITRRVAHDLNNMLVAVLGYAHLLAEDTAEPTLEIGQILNAAQRARELTGQILGYVGRPEQGFVDVDLSHLVDQTARLFEISVPKQVRVRYELAPDLPAVRAEPTRLRQVIMNLIINAAEAVRRRGEIVIRTAVVTEAPLPAPFAAERNRLPLKAYGVVEVRDDGHGMDEGTLQRAFEPFFTSKPEGRGLGLATVAEIMSEHYGAIAVETAVNSGTTFRVFFPLASRTGRRSPVEADTPGEGRTPIRRQKTGATVLVVDGEELVRGMAVTALERAGFNVLQAGDAGQAVEVLEAHDVEVDLVLLDLQLEDQDGMSVARSIRASSPKSKLLYCTGIGRERASALAADPSLIAGVLAKPYTPTVLVSRIDEVLGLKR
jgi:signal transduction histidine kinase